MTSKVGVFALITLIVVEMIECEFANIIKVFALGVFNSFIQIEPLVFGALHTFFEYFFF